MAFIRAAGPSLSKLAGLRSLLRAVFTSEVAAARQGGDNFNLLMNFSQSREAPSRTWGAED